MEFVGQILKKNRENKNLTILEVSKELKISEEIINNIENSNFQTKIDNVYLIGHLRSYCSFLDLNQKELVEQFKNEYFPQDKIKITIDKPKLDNNIFFSRKFFSLSLIIFIFATFYFLFIEVDKPSRDYAIIPDLPENYVSIIEKASLDNSIKKTNTEVNKKNFAELENYSSSSSVIASTKKDDEMSQIVTLKFLDTAWIQLRDENDEIKFSQLMNKNDEYSYDLNLNYSITSGNAGHILVLINQKVRGKIGKTGQVVDSFVLNKDFNN